jgi:N-methylhydantoinase B
MMQAGRPIDAITLEVLRHALTAVAEEMNANLIRSAYSPNIKERRDCSSALFDAAGQMIAQAESIPVHLGAMPYSVAAAVRAAGSFLPGDIVVLNDPYAGGAHLPDITFVAPVFSGDRLVAFVANRAHHADVGGKEPGSLSGDTVEIFQEGLRIPPVRLWRKGEVDHDLLDLILLNVRTPGERWGDLRAQRAACRTGTERLTAVIERYGVERVSDGMSAILEYSERRMRGEIERMPDGTATFSDVLDNDGISDDPIPIRVAVAIDGDRIVFDFTGTAEQVNGPVNAVLAVTSSATFYAVRALTDPEIPPNAGCYRPIEIVAPAGSLVNPVPPAPVVGGNLETSQRIVDVILGAMERLAPGRAIAACQGSMNNFAIGGTDPRTGGPYSLYETIAGGYGARPDRDGVDGIHSHMTNTLNTPVEALEIAYPLRVERYELRAGSGGEGRYRGGLGIRRDIRSLGPDARVSLLTERRVSRPYGIAGGKPGRPGENLLIRDGEEIALPAKGSVTLGSGDIISIRTPGGGGYGVRAERDPAAIDRDRREERI